MVRTQIQLPEELFRQVKALADDKEWSVAEALRRGAEALLRSYPAKRTRKSAWRLPAARALGRFLRGPGEWREAAHEVPRARRGRP